MFVKKMHWFDPSPWGESTGTQCRICYGWRDDFRHLYGIPPNLADALDAPARSFVGVGLVTASGKHRKDPRSAGRRAVQPVRLGAPLPAGPQMGRAQERARKILREEAEKAKAMAMAKALQQASPRSPRTTQSEAAAASTLQESALVF